MGRRPAWPSEQRNPKRLGGGGQDGGVAGAGQRARALSPRHPPLRCQAIHPPNHPPPEPISRQKVSMTQHRGSINRMSSFCTLASCQAYYSFTKFTLGSCLSTMEIQSSDHNICQTHCHRYPDVAIRGQDCSGSLGPCWPSKSQL